MKLQLEKNTKKVKLNASISEDVMEDFKDFRQYAQERNVSSDQSILVEKILEYYFSTDKTFKKWQSSKN